VIDTGFDLRHPELKSKVDVANSRDFLTGQSQIVPHYHGQRVFGKATQGTNRIDAMALRAMAEPVVEDARPVVDAIEHAAAHGARVINMSWRADRPETTAEIKKAMERHPEILFVKSAGNNGAKLGEGAFAPDRYLSANTLDNMLVVSAANADGTPAAFTN